MKQTAVEWLLERLLVNGYITLYDQEKAKEMEKQQIVDANLLGLIYPLEIEASKQAEQYYNETYKVK